MITRANELALSIVDRSLRGVSQGVQSRFPIQTQKTPDDLVPTLVVLYLPRLATILVQDRFSIDTVVACSRNKAIRVEAGSLGSETHGEQSRFSIQTYIGGPGLVPVIIIF